MLMAMKQKIKTTIWTLAPPPVRNLYQVGKILRDMGYLRSIKHQRPVAVDGDVMPWYTYPCIAYLNQLNFRTAQVFEWGSGFSTRWWAERAAHVTSVEDDAVWAERVKAMLPASVTYTTAQNDEYVQAIRQAGTQYDVIIVDGSHRPECATEAVQHLAPEGLIILDNADWYPQTASRLRGANLIEIDFTGFGPINPYTWTTSLFLQRNFYRPPRADRQPIHGIGSLDHMQG